MCGATKKYPPNPFELEDTKRLRGDARMEQQAARLARRIQQAVDVLGLNTVSWEELQEREYRGQEAQDRESDDD